MQIIMCAGELSRAEQQMFFIQQFSSLKESILDTQFIHGSSSLFLPTSQVGAAFSHVYCRHDFSCYAADAATVFNFMSLFIAISNNSCS